MSKNIKKNLFYLFIALVTVLAIYFASTQLTTSTNTGDIEIPTANSTIEIPTTQINDGSPDLS